ncbi:MAG: lipopolysaccharide transport periplasmic protein LptA [Gammaproteobacteria bacterium]
MARAAAPAGPITVDADHSVATRPSGSGSGTVTYDGHVVITRGGKAIVHGAHAVVYISHQHLQKAVVTGSPAQFSWQPDKGLPVHGQALKITYFAAENSVEMEQQARLHRGKEVFSAARIHYSLTTQVLKAEGKTGSKQGGRVHVVIPPASSAGGPAAGPP